VPTNAKGVVKSMSQQDVVLFYMPEMGGFHLTAWREAEAPADPVLDFAATREAVRLAERGRFHAFFIADAYAVRPLPPTALSRTAKATRFEPLTLLSALAASTQRIGLLGTASTTYQEPYHVARQFASLDHISGGRAGWNVVTSGATNEAANFGREEHMVHADRYERAQEFFDVVTGLWDSWEDDAFLRDKQSGVYFDPDKLHPLEHQGKYVSVAGPLNIARPPQGHPVIAQAGSSPAGQAFAARNADVVYTLQADVRTGQRFYAELKDQVAECGRDPEHVKVLPALKLLVGRSQAAAEEKLARLDELVDPQTGMEALRVLIGADLSGVPLDGPVPDVPQTTTGSTTAQAYYLDLARRDGLTVRQLMQLAARHGTVAGDAGTVADLIQDWFEAGAADGINVTFGDTVGSLQVFVDEVVPELQRRGVYHERYRGTTLRDDLGIPRPPNRFATSIPPTAKVPA